MGLISTIERRYLRPCFHKSNLLTEGSVSLKILRLKVMIRTQRMKVMVGLEALEQS